MSSLSVNFRIILLLLIILLAIPKTEAQTSFAIDKGGRVKRVHFYIGSKIGVKDLKTDARYFGELTFISDSMIAVNGQNIMIKDIDFVIDPTRRYGWILLSKVSIRAALIYFLLDSGNRVINKESPIVDNRNLKITLPIAGIAIISTLLRNKRYKHKDNNMKMVQIE